MKVGPNRDIGSFLLYGSGMDGALGEEMKDLHLLDFSVSPYFFDLFLECHRFECSLQKATITSAPVFFVWYSKKMFSFIPQVI